MVAKRATEEVAKSIDGNRVDEFIAKGFEAKGYAETRNILEHLKECYPNAEYLYVYKIEEDGMRVVFDLDTETVPAEAPGTLVPPDEAFRDSWDALLAGEEVEAATSDDKYGYLLTVYTPIKNSRGLTVCYAGIDISMDAMTRSNTAFMIKVITSFASFLILVFVLAAYMIEYSIMIPLNAMAIVAGSFSYDTEEERESNLKKLRRLNVTTDNEIENLYDALLKNVIDAKEYMGRFKAAKSEVSDMKIQVEKISETAYLDGLTGVNNKAAYMEDTKEIIEAIEKGTAHFAIIMIDLNNLKKVNDTYGHEKGDAYIIGAGKMLSDIFGSDSLYRFGGDEFVVLLRGEKYGERNRLYEMAEKRFEEQSKNESIDPWERFSGACGMAEYERGDSIESVFKRADGIMYENKILMKGGRDMVR